MFTGKFKLPVKVIHGLLRAVLQPALHLLYYSIQHLVQDRHLTDSKWTQHVRAQFLPCFGWLPDAYAQARIYRRGQVLFN